MSMNHCRLMSGSMRAPDRWLNGTVWTYSSRPRMRPSASSRATTAACASATVIPGNAPPAASVMRPSSPMTEISCRPCLRPISKSFGS